MYKCGICSTVSNPGQPRRTFILYRDYGGATQIEHELPVCTACADALASGVAYDKLAAQHALKPIIRHKKEMKGSQ